MNCCCVQARPGGCQCTSGTVLSRDKQSLSCCCLPCRRPPLQLLPAAEPWWLSRAPVASCQASILEAIATCHSEIFRQSLNKLPLVRLFIVCRCCPGGCHPNLRHRAGRLPLPDHECHHLPQKRFSSGRPHLHVYDPHSGSSVVHVVPTCASALHCWLLARMLQHGAGPAAHCYATLHGGMPLH